MFKLILIAAAVIIAYKLFANDFFKKRDERDKKDQQEMERQAQAGDLIKDPICGTYVSPDDAIRVKDGEEKFFFCSYECRDTFLKKHLETSNQIESVKQKALDNEE